MVQLEPSATEHKSKKIQYRWPSLSKQRPSDLEKPQNQRNCWNLK